MALASRRRYQQIDDDEQVDAVGGTRSLWAGRQLRGSKVGRQAERGGDRRRRRIDKSLPPPRQEPQGQVKQMRM